MAVPSYLEDTAKDYAKQATAAYSVPIDTTKFTGQQFVAGEDPLQTSAINLAQQGVGSYSPYLQQAQAAATQAGAAQASGAAQMPLMAGQIGAAGTTVGGLGALTGAQAYQPFMSPYQTQVIDESLRQYDLSRQGGQQQIRDAAVGAGGFGGGREGAMLGQYDADTLANRTGLQAQLLAQGYGQAQQGAQQHFANQANIANMQSGLAGQYGNLAGQYGNLMNQQLGLGREQMNLSNFQRAGLGADVGALGQLGSLRQAQEQAQLTANQQMHKTAAYEPYGRLSQYGAGITGLAGGMAGPAYAEPQQSSPYASALSTATGLGGLYRDIFHPQKFSIPGLT
jgi:hypothetical protein